MTLRFTLIDKRIRRVGQYGAYPGILAVAAQNPATIEAFCEAHEEIAGVPLYPPQRIEETLLEGITEEGLRMLLLRKGVARKTIGRRRLPGLLTLARKPIHQDYAPNKSIGTGLNGDQQYDGAILIDLRKNEIAIRGRPELPPHQLQRGTEVLYKHFRLLSEIRSGTAVFVDQGDGPRKTRRVGYRLDDPWEIVDRIRRKTY